MSDPFAGIDSESLNPVVEAKHDWRAGGDLRPEQAEAAYAVRWPNYPILVQFTSDHPVRSEMNKWGRMCHVFTCRDLHDHPSTVMHEFPVSASTLINALKVSHDLSAGYWVIVRHYEERARVTNDREETSAGYTKYAARQYMDLEDAQRSYEMVKANLESASASRRVKSWRS